MIKNEFLDALCDFTRNALRELRLPVEPQEEDREPSPLRPPEVYAMGLPGSGDQVSKLPYVLCQIITAKDIQPHGSGPESSAVARLVAGVYHPDSQEGPRALLGLFERLRLPMLSQCWLGGRFELDTSQGVEYLIYDTQTEPYYFGEMLSTWKLPPIEREVIYEEDGFNW